MCCWLLAGCWLVGVCCLLSCALSVVSRFISCHVMLRTNDSEPMRLRRVASASVVCCRLHSKTHTLVHSCLFSVCLVLCVCVWFLSLSLSLVRFLSFRLFLSFSLSAFNRLSVRQSNIPSLQSISQSVSSQLHFAFSPCVVFCIDLIGFLVWATFHFTTPDPPPHTRCQWN